MTDAQRREVWRRCLLRAFGFYDARPGRTMGEKYATKEHATARFWVRVGERAVRRWPVRGDGT